jgi:signal peptidase I
MLNAYLTFLLISSVLVYCHYKGVYEFAGKHQISVGRFYPLWYAQNAVLIGVLSALYLFVTVVALERFKIPSPSMLPNFAISQQILANKFAFTVQNPITRTPIKITGRPKRGEVIITRMPLAPDVTFIKRVWGLPGDSVGLTQDALIINDEVFAFTFVDVKEYEYQDKLYVVDELKLRVEGHDYLFYRDRSKPFNEQAIITVPENQYFVLGDNLDHSSDSRTFGFIHQHNLLAALL